MLDVKPPRESPCTCPEGWYRQHMTHHRECATWYSPSPLLDVGKMEAASDRLVALASSLGLSRAEMASACIAIAANHLMATNVSEERAGLSMIAMYRWRRGHGINPALLVTDPPVHVPKTRPPGWGVG